MDDGRMGKMGDLREQGFMCAEQCSGFIDLVATKRSGTRMEVLAARADVPTEVGAAQGAARCTEFFCRPLGPVLEVHPCGFRMPERKFGISVRTC